MEYSWKICLKLSYRFVGSLALCCYCMKSRCKVKNKIKKSGKNTAGAFPRFPLNKHN